MVPNEANIIKLEHQMKRQTRVLPERICCEPNVCECIGIILIAIVAIIVLTIIVSLIVFANVAHKVIESAETTYGSKTA